MAVSWHQEELKDMACMLKLFRDVCGGGGRRRVKKWEEATEIGIPREQRKTHAFLPEPGDLASEYSPS